jgi:hypothetical protein
MGPDPGMVDSVFSGVRGAHKGRREKMPAKKKAAKKAKKK